MLGCFQANSISGESEIAKAKMAVCERGNKLNEVEERTERLATDAQVNFTTINYCRTRYLIFFVC